MSIANALPGSGCSKRGPCPMPEVWKVDVVAEARRLDRHLARLTGDEAARAARLRREEDRERFVVGRSTRRLLVASRLGVDAETLVFVEGRHGKPGLPAGSQARPLHFNSSHSGRWVLHAIADVEVGIDVERVRPEFARVDDFLWVLSPDERRLVQGAPERCRAAVLATVWVRKEAYVKALGEGLSRSLPDIGIACASHGEPVLAYDRNAGASGRRWRFADLGIDELHKACLVHEGALRPIVVREFAA